jgi:hypothetical protein
MIRIAITVEANRATLSDAIDGHPRSGAVIPDHPRRIVNLGAFSVNETGLKRQKFGCSKQDAPTSVLYPALFRAEAEAT